MSGWSKHGRPEIFVGRWLLNNCTSDNNYCGGRDLDTSSKVDLEDWTIFAQHWLEEISYIQSITVGDCLTNSEFEGAQIQADPSDPLRFSIVVQGQMILFKDLVNTNCCKEEIQLSVSVIPDKYF